MLQGLRRLRKSEVFTFRTFGVPRGPLNPLHYYCVCCPLGRREFFSSFFFRPGRPGGPSIGCSILMFAAMWVPPGFPGASVLWFFQLFLRGGRPGGPSIRCSILRFAAIWPAPGCSVVLFVGFRVAPRRARSPPHADSLRRGAVCLARHQIWCLSATPKACRTQTVWSPRGVALRAPSVSSGGVPLCPRGEARCPLVPPIWGQGP